MFISIGIIIIYMQAFYGPRFMLSSKYQEKNEIFYLSKKELIKEKPKSKYEKCPICLIPLFDKNKIKKDNELNIDGNCNNNCIINAKNKFLNKTKKFYELNLGQEDINIYKEFIKRIIKSGFFCFYKYDYKLLRKYILIPCGHFFHSKCLENWIKIEKNCPLCRQVIPDL